MCCSPDHLGAPPEWHREAAAEADERPGEVIPPPPRVTAATLAAWARFLGNRPPGPRPASTEGGQGRALLTALWVPWAIRPGAVREREGWTWDLDAPDSGGPLWR